jgi:hypothetical protein
MKSLTICNKEMGGPRERTGKRRDIGPYIAVCNQGARRLSRMRGQDAQKYAADKFARNVSPVIEDIRNGGITTLTGIAAQLRARGVRTVRGGKWTATSVRNVLARITR